MEEDMPELKDEHKKHHSAQGKNTAHHVKRKETEYMEHKAHKHNKTVQVTGWVFGIISLILFILLIVSITTKGFSGGSQSAQTAASTAKALSQDELKTKTIAYLNKLMPDQEVSVDSIKDEGDIYSMKLTVSGRSYDSFARKDGSFLFPSGMDMNQQVQTPAADTAAQQPTTVPKTDKPVVELFVMSHCPFGTQAEKGILPAVRALGDKIDFKIRFVYYAMHGETEVNEQLNQYCIQKEQPNVFLKYLACFLNESDSPGCLKSTGVDEAKMKACTVAADTQYEIKKNLDDKSLWLSGRFPKFNTDAELNTKYGVGGSPTLVINGANSNAGRDAVSYLAGICAAFNTPPAECQTQLDATTPGPGFGYGTSAAATAAGCGV